MNTKARIRDWLEAADFNGEGCSHSYLTISLAVGCSETHAIRLVRELENAEEVDVDRAPRGSKRPNTYRVRGRNPRLRAPVLLRLSEVKLLRRELCQSKGTAASKGSNPIGKDNRSNVLVSQRCGRARAWSGNPMRKEARNQFDRRNRVPEPARPPLKLVEDPYGVSGLADECQRLRLLVAIAFSLADTHRLDLELAERSLRYERRRGREKDKQIRNLRKTREQNLKETANIELIERLAAFHRQHVRPDSRKPGPKTIEAVRARLADKVPGSDEPAYSPRYVAEAILGAKHEAWTTRDGKRMDALAYICSTPEQLEAFHDAYERHRAGRAA